MLLVAVLFVLVWMVFVGMARRVLYSVGLVVLVGRFGLRLFLVLLLYLLLLLWLMLWMISVLLWFLSFVVIGYLW